MGSRRRRAGSKRQLGPRGKNGRLIRERDATDGGTPQIQQQRAWLAQRCVETPDPKTGKTRIEIQMGDMTKTTYPLGVLLTNGTVDQAQHDAGVRYARLYAAVAGRTAPPAVVLDDDRAGRAPEDSAEMEKRRIADEALLRAAAAALQAAGSRVKTVTDNVAVYGRMPRWMLPVRPRASDIREADALMAGLEALAVALGMRRGARRVA